MSRFVEITCPACWQKLSIAAHPEDGDEQEIVVDCEVCCRPIAVTIAFDPDGEPDGSARRVEE